MNKLFLLSAAVISLCSFLTPEEQGEWTEHFRNEIAAVDADPTYEQIRMLCDLVASDSETDHANEIRALAWARLQKIPDFPDRIYKNILDHKSEWDSKQENPYNYNRARGWGIPRLGRLPHHGSVRVLGEFLYDDELPGYDSEFEAAVKGGTSSNSIFAIRALGRLVDKPPVQGDPEKYTRNDVRTWQLWFEQVKSGSRTFRLKGNPQEFSLAGPASEIRTATTGSSLDSNPSPTETAASAKKMGHIPVVGIVGAVALLSLALWTVARRNAARG
jgi:hypothetical protein